MSDRGVAVMHAAKLRLRQPDAVAEHGAAADQAVMVIDVEESFRSGNSEAMNFTSSRFSAMWVCTCSSGCSFHSAPAASSWAGVLRPSAE
jgi:hypothetical protein